MAAFQDDARSETSSFSEHLSPTDGYFAQRDHPQHLYIENSVATSSGARSKAQEAEDDRTSTYTSTSALDSPSTHSLASLETDTRPAVAARHRSLPWTADEATLLLDATDAPPAYSPRDEERNNARLTTGYGTHNPAWTPAFAPQTAPQSMGPPRGYTAVDNPQNHVVAPVRISRRCDDFWPQSWPSRPRRKTLVISAAVFLFIVILIVVSTLGKSHDSVRFFKPPSEKSRLPEDDGFNWPSHCPNISYTNWFGMPYDNPIKLNVIEQAQGSHIVIGSAVSGTIRIADALPDQMFPVMLNLSFATSDANMMTQVKWHKQGDSLILQPPPSKGFFDKRCMAVSATFHVADGFQLQDLAITSQNLNFQTIHTGNFSVEGITIINLTSGDLDAVEPLNSRRTVIDTTSGSIHGRYALRDLLSIRTTSGSVSVDVEPKEVDQANPAPAEFVCRCTSGSISARFPIPGAIHGTSVAQLPGRDYRTTITSTDGSISGDLVHGSATTILTTASSIDVALQPYSADDTPSTLRTASRSGTTKLTMYSPYKDPGTVINRMSSKHASVSGSLQLVYPQEWEGTIEGEVVSGSVTILGEDVEVIDKSSPPIMPPNAPPSGPLIVPPNVPPSPPSPRSPRKAAVRKHTSARKGNGKSALSFGSTSGSVTLLVGDP